MLGVKRNSEHVNVTEGMKSQPASKKGQDGVGRIWVKRQKEAEKDGARGRRTDS